MCLWKSCTVEPTIPVAATILFRSSHFVFGEYKIKSLAKLASTKSVWRVWNQSHSPTWRVWIFPYVEPWVFHFHCFNKWWNKKIQVKICYIYMSTHWDVASLVAHTNSYLENWCLFGHFGRIWPFSSIVDETVKGCIYTPRPFSFTIHKTIIKII